MGVSVGLCGSFDRMLMNVPGVKRDPLPLPSGQADTPKYSSGSVALVRQDLYT